MHILLHSPLTYIENQGDIMKLALLLFLLFSLACGNNRQEPKASSQEPHENGATTTNPSENKSQFCQVQQVFNNHCVKCHSTGGKKPDLSSTGLTNSIDKAYRDGKYWIKGGSIADSQVFDAISKGRMPKNAEPLSEQDISLIQSWIETGAKIEQCN